MRKSSTFRFLFTLLMIISLLSPTAVLAFGEGKKQFKKGLKHEAAEEWDKAVEAFALAVADNPKNPEYRLHYRRALFNASQMFMKRGRLHAEEKDYEAAYTAFRRAYGYDPVNELAKSEMQRMIRLQKALIDGKDDDSKKDGVNIVKTSNSDTAIPKDVVIPQRYEVLRNVVHPNPFPLVTLIRDLAESLDLNVLFDSASRIQSKKITIELKNVTAAQALDAIFLQENLIFEKVGPRTILVANSTRRQFFSKLVLRTFYLGNADPKKVASIIQKAIPAQPGRTPTIVLTDEDTNSLTIRDTAENIRLMSKLIKSLDKDRAEVVMDVQIFEVSKNDLLQIGNQIGNESQLTNLGGTTRGSVTVDRGNIFSPLSGLPGFFGVGIAVPSSTLSAFQRKNKTKLIASTQIHAFNNEDSSARIGQRVPVQTASVIPFNSGTNTGTNTGNVFGNGFPVINYEQTGLTLKFKPIVFPNQDVQVTMDIESKDVIDAGTPTPTFTERSIKGTARVQNNKTLLLASVAQNVESRGREGIPLLGLIPILGRLFTTPTRDNRQTDIVIAVTPRVIRAPAILPEDLEERPSGTLATPTGSSLQAMLIREEVERQQNLAKFKKRNPNVQLPDAPTYVKSTGNDTTSSVETKKEDNKSTAVKTESEEVVTKPKKTDSIATNLKPINSKKVRTLNLAETLNSSNKPKEETLKVKETSLTEKPVKKEKAEEKDNVKKQSEIKENVLTARLELMPKVPQMKAGEKTTLAVMIRSANAFRSAYLGLSFDDKKVAIRKVSYGDVFGREISQIPEKPFLNQGGKMYVSLTSPKDVSQNSSGILAFIEIEALEDGTPEINFLPDMLNLMTADGNSFLIDF